MFQAIKNILGIGPRVDIGELISNGATIVDVRTPAEFSRGHVKGSVNIPLDKLSSQASKLKGKTLVLCCASGMRSGSAVSMLKSKGFESVYNGGSWTNVDRCK